MRPASSELIRLVLVESFPLVCEGLMSCFRDSSYITVVGTAATAECGFKLVAARHPNVVFLDLQLPDTSGVELAAHLHAVSPEIPIVALARDEPSHLFHMMRQSGITAMVQVGDPLCHVVEIIRFVSTEKNLLPKQSTVVDPSVVSTVHLTRREREVLKLVGMGKGNADIAEVLHVSIRTIESHLDHAFMKLEAHSRTEALAIAHKFGVLADSG